MVQILGVFFNPPMAIARLGGSATPLEAYTWSEDPSLFGSGKTVIRPAITLEVQNDGSVRPYLPSFIRFRDDHLIRPVAPFFELWARVVQSPRAPIEEVPLTLSLLEAAGGSLDGVTYHITAANRKAERRTGDPACSFMVGIDIRGTDYRHRELLASSPRRQGVEALVPEDHPISLGYCQAIRPIRAIQPAADGPKDAAIKPAVEEMGVDLGVLRIRFTPARGEVYGSPLASTAPAPDTGRVHEIVPAENRILNPRSSWLAYDADYSRYVNPEPSDTYDGAGTGTDGRSWGVVDDTCDLLVEAYVVIGGVRLLAVARAFSGPPDFAPDRRHFNSLADILADREKPFVDPIDEDNDDLTIAEVADLFQRVFETVSLTNLDRLRDMVIPDDTPNAPPLPLTNADSMTAKDKPYADAKLIDVLGPSAPHMQLPYSTAARQTHADLADVEVLLSLMRNKKRVVQMIRPPYARFQELSSRPDSSPSVTRLRDVRNPRDNAQDMRMPPYMRNETADALSVTRRQYDEIVKLLEYLSKEARRAAKKRPTKKQTLKSKRVPEGAVPGVPEGRADTPLWRHVGRVVERHHERQAEDRTGTRKHKASQMRRKKR
jgi:hypothetical protein